LSHHLPKKSGINRVVQQLAGFLLLVDEQVGWGQSTRKRVSGAIMKLGRTSLLALAIIAAIPGAAIAQNSSKTPAPPLPPQTSTEIPEPGDFALFLIGVAGLVVGRWTSKARKRRQE